MSHTEYLSAPDLRKLQLCMLKEVDAFCRKNELTYFLTYGTLIGAIRHSGFIPWDDDIDILMPRPDYERFIRTYEARDSFVISDEQDPDYQYLFAKVSDKRTVLVEDTSKKADVGAYIDVFALDGLPDSAEECTRHIKKKIWWVKLFNIKRLKLFSSYRAFYKSLLLLILKLVLLPVPYRYILKRVKSIMTRYAYDSSDNVVEMVFATPDRAISKRVFSDAIQWQFEDSLMNVPVGYDEYLKSIYGDYMTLPPEDQRITHHRFKVYRKE
ncbi:MAG: LicD family protein [Bacteroidales bacterium]|nr:LicD family protein [Bacteroidales bacterium]